MDILIVRQEWSERCCWWLKDTDQRHLNTLGHTGGIFSKHHPASRVKCTKMRNTGLELLRACQEHWAGVSLSCLRLGVLGCLLSQRREPPIDLSFCYWHQELTNARTRQPTPHPVIFTVTWDQAAKVSLLPADSMLCTTPQQSATGSPPHLPVSPRVFTRQLYRLPVHQKATSYPQYGNLANCLGC